jgi:hypothetical protein
VKEKVTNQLNVQVDRSSFLDEGEGVVSFPGGLTITDNTAQRNGTRYDIDSMDISKYGSQLTGDHEDKLSSLIGEVIGVNKDSHRVTVEKIRYAIRENPYAQLAYDLLTGGFSKNFSIETIGAYPDEDGVYWDAELVGLSQVVTQNNYNASLNKLVHNSLERSKKNGLNVEGIEESFLGEHAEAIEKTKNDATQKIEQSKVAKDSEVNITIKVDTSQVENAIELAEKLHKTLDKTNSKQENKMDEDKKVETPVVEEPKVETPAEVPVVAPVEEPVVVTPVAPEEETKEEPKVEVEEPKVEQTPVDQNAIAEAVKNAVAAEAEKMQKDFDTKLEAVKVEAKNAFDKSAQEPTFKKEETAKVEKTENKYKAMDNDTRYNAQVAAAWNAVKGQSIVAWDELRQINQVNLEALKAEGLVKNSITLEDIGNFVISPELHKEIVGVRNDYTGLLAVTNWAETDSIEFAWTERVGDINMQNVAFCDDDADGNLKPISEFGTVVHKESLEELAAVTPICNAATRFAAVDLLQDAAMGYRTDYDRKRAQLVVAKLEQAVDATGNSVAYNQTSDTTALVSWLQALTEISDQVMNGVLIFNNRTFAELKTRALSAGVTGPLAEVLTGGGLQTIFGMKFLVVPNDLMPTLGGSDTVTVQVNGEYVTINHAVFYADLSQFKGRTSGGLQYDVSSQAAYEDSGVVKSAYQRNELVLRGSFFRGGAFLDRSRVAGIHQTTVS